MKKEIQRLKEIFKNSPYEFRFWLECEYKPFTETQHKCLRCRECTPTQFWFCKGLCWGRKYTKEELNETSSKKRQM